MTANANQRRARIVCTLGPATASPARISQLIAEGMDIARLNMSHGSPDGHRATIARIRAAEEQSGRPIAIIADLQGPKIRLGSFAGGHALLEDGADFTLDNSDAPGDATRASTSHHTLSSEVREGDTLYLDDGLLELAVAGVEGDRVRTRVIVGGEISDRKGVNIPSGRLSAPVLSEKDREDLGVALEAGADWIALSFVRHASDVETVRDEMKRVGILRPVIAKIETPQAVDELEAIIAAFDGVMVARGDLGLETPLEKLPAVQRTAVSLARRHGIPAIVATQMLDSMIGNPTPTRAEVSDVATAVLDGADAVMLSGETSVGKYPVRAARQMRRIIEVTEAEPRPNPLPVADSTDPSDVMADAAIRVAEQLDACALCAFTASGRTARSVARHRAPVPIVALTSRPEVVRALRLCWGVEPIHVGRLGNVDEMVELAERELPRCSQLDASGPVVLLASSPIGESDETNLLRVIRTAD